MQGKSLLAGCIIVALSAVCLAGYFKANSQLTEVERYSLMRVDQGQLIVQLGQQLVWLDEAGNELRNLDFNSLGIKTVGDFAVFANGDLLVYHRPQAPSLLQNLKAFAREQELQPAAAIGDEGFKRCNADGCQAFSQALPAFNGSFRLLIEPQNQRVHIAHTSEFRLYLLDEDGQLLASGDTHSLRFPNQLQWVDGLLWVADTNNARLAQLKTDPEQYAAVESSLNINLSRSHRWPHQMVWDGQHWWINLGDHALSNGRLVQINQQGELLQEITAHQVEDPLALAWFGQQLWWSEFAQPKLWRFDPNSQKVSSHHSATLQQLEQQATEQLNHWQLLSNLALCGLGLVFIGGLIAAWYLERNETKQFLQTPFNPLKKRIDQPATAIAPGETIWLSNHMDRWHSLLWASVPLTALLAASLLAAFLIQDVLLKHAPIALLSGWCVCLAGSMYWLRQTMREQRVGVQDKQLLLQQSPGKQVIIPFAELQYDQQFLYSQHLCVQIYLQRLPVFDRQQLDSYLYPRLKNSTSIGPLRALKRLWKNRHPSLFIALLPLLYVLFAVAFLALR